MIFRGVLIFYVHHANEEGKKREARNCITGPTTVFYTRGFRCSTKNILEGPLRKHVYRNFASPGDSFLLLIGPCVMGR